MISMSTLAQQQPVPSDYIITYEEYLGFVKQHHPLVKQANLKLNIGESTLLQARGGFDPKIEVDYDRKKFKGTEYYDRLNAAFKIPTWYGIELKANFEENSGEFLDPSLTVPEDGLYSAGVSFSVAQGFLINERMAALKQARFYLDQSRAQRDISINKVLFESSKAYFEWIEAYNETLIYEAFLSNAEIRFNGVKRRVEEGDQAAIDSIEAKITFQNRVLSLEAAQLKLRKSKLKASNYLWINGVPLQIEDESIPQVPERSVIWNSLAFETEIENRDTLALHPRLRSLDARIEQLKVERSLKRNNLLPKLDLQYNFLTPDYEKVNSLNTANYKAAFNFSVPLFLRKERGALQLANWKLQDVNFERMSTSLTLKNQLFAATAELSSLTEQNLLITEIVLGTTQLVEAENRKFDLGESSLFLVNSREQKLIETSLKANNLQFDLLNAHLRLFNALGNANRNILIEQDLLLLD
ncbi:Outer membrane protein TolC [Flavobacteriaceae bacterium MAR_2010_188]|nr:Outer membrane protein TolC [Flavobacteriaceae bacterium MAR_2010_188]